MKTIYTLFMLAAVVSFTSCNRDDDQPVTPAGVDTEEAIEGTWMLQGLTVDPAFDEDQDGTADTDIFATFPECRQDNLFEFTEGNTYEQTEGATACPGNQPGEEIEDGTYTITGDDLVITKDVTDVKTYKIIAVDENTLSLTDNFEENDIEYTRTYTFQRQ